MAKWVAQIDRADRIPEYVARAFTTACAGRPGPVVLALPEDMLASETDVADAAAVPRRAAASRARSRSRSCAACSRERERPLVLVGGAGWTPRTSQDLRAFLEANALPAGAAFRRQDSIDNDSPSYVGDVGIGINPKLAARVREADLLLVVGPRLGEMTTSGYTLHRRRRRSCTSIPAPRSSAASTAPALPILSGMEHFAAAVRDLRVEPRWREWSAAARADYEAWQQHEPMPGALDLGDVHRAPARARAATRSSRTAPATSRSGCTASGAGTTTRRQLAPTSGAMGYGVPAAVAAKLRRARSGP